MHHRWLIVPLSLVAAACARAERNEDAVSDTAQAVEESDEQATAAEPAAADTGAASPSAAGSAATNREDPSLGRPAEITLTITGHRNYAGTYRAAGTSNTCGAQRSLATGEPSDAFAVEFPASATDDFEITSLAFYADTLPVAGGNTSRYKLDLGLRTKKGERPPSFIVNTANAGRSEPGAAAVTTNGGTNRLTVQGRNSYGTVEMTVLCKPKAG